MHVRQPPDTPPPAVHVVCDPCAEEEEYDEDYTVLKFQVGVFGDITKWQRDLARLSNLYDTDEEGGLHAIFIGAGP